MNDELIAVIMMFVVFGIYGIIFLIAIATYIFNGIALCTIAKRRLINNPWLSFIPLGNFWIVGKIAEDYDLKQNIKRNWAKTLMILSVVGYSIFIVSYIGILIFAMLMGFFSGVAPEFEAVAFPMIILFILAYLVLIAASLLMTAAGFLSIICIFKIFESINPEKALKYMLIYILVPIAGPYLLFKNRNNGYDYLPIEAEYEPETQGFNEGEEI